MSRFFARLAISIAALMVMMVASLFAAGFFALGLYLLLAQFMPAALAAVLTGVLVLVLAGLLAVAALAGTWRRRPGETERDRVTRETMAEIGDEFGQRLMGMVDRNKPTSMVAALIAGFAVGVSPKLRSFLLEILRQK